MKPYALVIYYNVMVEIRLTPQPATTTTAVTLILEMMSTVAQNLQSWSLLPSSLPPACP